MSILEHVSYQQGLDYLKKILEKKESQEFDWNLLLNNDSIGNPITYDFKNEIDNYNVKIILNNYNISPTTLRYISTGIDMIEYIIHNNLNNLDIVEIGGGYGGQCKILFDLIKNYNIKINSYSIIDLPSISTFQKKYLSLLNYNDNIIYQNFNNIIHKNYDLCISNYAIGEFEYDVQIFYINNVLKYSKYYYIIWNTENIPNYLIDSKILEEIPKTGLFNKILIK